MGRESEKQYREREAIRMGIEDVSEHLTRKATNTLMLKRRPSMDVESEDYDVLFGIQNVGRIYRSGDGASWHWRIFVTLSGGVIDARDRASSRESATAAFRERWDQLRLGERLR
jgi:hypothetical protein